jgi:hypothetical protein
MGLQAGAWAEMRVNVFIKQELPSKIDTHQLRRLGIKESFENSRILRMFCSFVAVNGTTGRIMGRNVSQCLYQADVAEKCQCKFQQTKIFADFSLNNEFFRRPGPLIWPRTSCASIFKRPKAVFH